MIGKKTNFALILHYISIVLIIESLFMIFAAAVAIIYNEAAIKGILLAIILLFSFGVFVFSMTWKWIKVEPGLKESLLIVSLSWILIGILGSLPYLLTGSIPGVINAVFESVSGFTTTGSSILVDIEALPKSILFWRSETHWIGGIGIIVMVIAIMPFLNIHGSRLFSSEASVVVEEKVTTRMRYVARNFGLIYLSLTFMEIFLLLISGMPIFDSICHSFGTIATGGFSTQNASIAGYSPVIHYIIAIFMILSGMNFTIHFFIVTGRIKKIWSNQELKYYLGIIGIVTLIITIALQAEKDYPIEWAFRSAFFQVASIITATGFATDDYLLWPGYAQMLIAMLMLIGASAGSTGGGVKVIRHVVFWKKINFHFKTINHPKAVVALKYGNKVISEEQVTEIIGYILLYYGIVITGAFFLMLAGNDMATSFGSVVTTMDGCGPGFGKVGPVSNFSSLNDISKLFLCGTMITGRLEIYPILLLFTRGFWRA